MHVSWVLSLREGLPQSVGTLTGTHYTDPMQVLKEKNRPFITGKAASTARIQPMAVAATFNFNYLGWESQLFG
jgi:hypothetical protein